MKVLKAEKVEGNVEPSQNGKMINGNLRTEANNEIVKYDSSEKRKEVKGEESVIKNQQLSNTAQKEILSSPVKPTVE